jgi:ribosomal protein S18 acetylase RimI-like enzyme
MRQLSNTSIRLARIEDAPQLAAAERVHAQTPGMLASAPDELEDGAFAAKIRDLGQLANGCYIVAVQGDQLVGHALLDPLRLRSTAHVVQLTIAVHPGFEGQGIGRLLMVELLEWARGEPSVEKVELRVRHENERAIELYRSLGFVQEGRFVRRVKTPDRRYLDDVAMGLWVGEGAR